LNDREFKEYWASVPSAEIADEMLDKIDDYYEFLSVSGRLDLWRRSWTYYYRPRLTGAMLNPAGQQGELTSMSVNNYRNLLVHLETMTTQQKANFEPRATNSDVKSQSQVILASGLLDYQMTEKRLERNIKRAVKDGLIFSEGFVRAEWDATDGKIYGQTGTGAPIYEGDIKYSNYNPLNVIRDFTKESYGPKDWVICRDFKNKHDLAAKFPDLRDKILNDSDDYIELARTTTLNYVDLENSDNIAVYTLLHPPTPALPNGRYAQILDNRTVLMDGPIPYDETHVYRLAPDEETGTIFGYTVAFDLLPVQAALDALFSTAITNNLTFGVQNILLPKGHDLSTSQLTGGLNVIEYDREEGKPEPLNLLSTPPEVYEFMNMLDRVQETLSGVNSVARGNPEASLKSGAALALVQSMAIQFNMSLQQSYAMLVEDVGTGTINLFKKYAAVPRVAAIVGKSNRPLMAQFTGDDLDMINRVTVDMGNPMTRTTAGKVNLAEQFMANGFVENPDQYIQVVTTGRLEPVIEGKQAELLLIKSENENLADGQPQRALITDQHAEHILEHKTVLASPEVRQDPNSPIVAATLEHIQEHINFLKTADPALLALIHQQSLMPPALPPGQDGGTADMIDPTSPVQKEAQDVQQPNMPNPPQGADPASAALIEGQQSA
jgi:hypothetical protein